MTTKRERISLGKRDLEEVLAIKGYSKKDAKEFIVAFTESVAELLQSKKADAKHDVVLTLPNLVKFTKKFVPARRVQNPQTLGSTPEFVDVPAKEQVKAKSHLK